VLTVKLKYTGEGLTPPKRRAEDGQRSIEEQTADSHLDG
jgi:hypothetical protein